MLWCDWPWRKTVICCDGTVVCGCSDPRAERRLGAIGQQTWREIWHGPVIEKMREGFVSGNPMQWCRTCELHYEVPDGCNPALAPEVPEGPLELYIEPTIACNLSCANSTCSKESGIYQTRNAKFLDAQLLAGALDALPLPLQRVQLYNYGEPVLHPKFADLIGMIKSRHPAWVMTSTNGLLLGQQELRENIIRAGLDEIIFSIDGADQETYERYRRGGDFDVAVRNLRLFIEDRRRLGYGKPYTIWRYILFRWNDDDRSLAKAQRLAQELGVDRFCFEATDYPADAYSLRFQAGNDDYERIRHLVWGQARFTFSSELTIRGLSRLVRPGKSFSFTVSARNCGRLPWLPATSYGIRYVSLGVSLYSRKGQLLQRDLAHVRLPDRVETGETMVIEGAAPAPEQRGWYRIGFDMVYEGVAWFSELGDRNRPRPLAQILVW